MTRLLLAFAIIGIAGCAGDRYEILEGERIVERMEISNISQDTLTIRFSSPTGLLSRRLVCDKWDGQCVVAR